MRPMQLLRTGSSVLLQSTLSLSLFRSNGGTKDFTLTSSLGGDRLSAFLAFAPPLTFISVFHFETMRLARSETALSGCVFCLLTATPTRVDCVKTLALS